MKIIGRVLPVVFFLSLNPAGLTQTEVSKPNFSKTVDPVILTVIVTNERGNFITGLRRENFQVFIEKESANIIDFREDDVPHSVGIIFDASASVGNPRSMRPLIKSAQQSLMGFLNASNPGNEYFMLAFNIKPQLLQDWTSDSKAIIDALNLLQPKGGTALYDACYLAIDKVQHGRSSKRALILISDGLDNLSTYTFNQVRQELRASDVPVYAVNFSDSGYEVSQTQIEGEAILDEFCEVSGGRSFTQRKGRPLTKSEATSAFESIAQELRHQYTIAVRPPVSAANSKWHKLKIKVEADGEMKHLSARTREGFYVNQRND